MLALRVILVLPVAKQVDDLPCAGTKVANVWFIENLTRFLKIGKSISALEPIHFDDIFTTVQENGDAHSLMQIYLQSIKLNAVSCER